MDRGKNRSIADETASYFHHDRNRLLAMPWPETRPHLQHNTTDTPDVNFDVVPCLLIGLNDLGRHPEYSALQSGKGLSF